MKKKYILALDQGTTSCRAILFNHASQIVQMAQKTFPQYYPQPGWVEQDAMEIWATQYKVIQDVLSSSNISIEEIAGIGITNQRETTVVWDKQTGIPIYNAIVWQSRQTASICENLKTNGHEAYIKKATGLVVDAYFSGTKIKWILDHVPDARAKAEKGDLLFGTMDTWLIWQLTKGALHITDYSNASRTLLYNIDRLTWDDYLLNLLEIPKTMLPTVGDSSAYYGSTHPDILNGIPIPIAGIAGDQQAALFGQTCFEKGAIKNTYGTGAFLLMNTGKERIHSKHNLLSTIAWGINGEITYALEGSVFVAGAAIQWLRDELELIPTAAASSDYANKVMDSNGVYVVPAFAGLGTPYWDMYARGTIVGLTRGSNKYHIVRATLESIAYQSNDVIAIMTQEAHLSATQLKVDGGASANNFLMQFQADISTITVLRPKIIETTALGAAYLAGLAVNFWENQSALLDSWQLEHAFHPNMTLPTVQNKRKEWAKAIKKSMHWLDQ